jgi:hypothetical protein
MNEAVKDLTGERALGDLFFTGEINCRSSIKCVPLSFSRPIHGTREPSNTVV